jgi:glycosyltransferase involved in cell wall biosynthesis/protein-tyrosine-phosphatase
MESGLVTSTAATEVAAPVPNPQPPIPAAIPAARRRNVRLSSAVPASAEIPALHVCHVISGDLWAGAEVQVATTVAYLVQQPGLALSAVLFNEGTLAERLRALSIPVTVIDERRHGAFAITRTLTRLFRETQVDIVHTHRYSDTVVAATAAICAGVPRVVRTVHGLREPLRGWKRLKFALYELLESIALTCRADLIIAVSEQIAGDFHTARRHPEVTQIRNAIDVRTVVAKRPSHDVRRELGIRRGTIVIGTAGRLDPVKGHATLLRAAAIVLRQGIDAVVLIVGDGPLRHALWRIAVDLGIERSCIFTGARLDVYDLINTMDVFALPSLSEGIPMALLEAMALQVPVVATAVGGVPEVVQHGVSGLLVAPEDPEALAAACLTLTRDPDRARWLIARSRQVVRESFAVERNGQELLLAYRSLGARPQRVRALDLVGLCGSVVLHAIDVLESRVVHAFERFRQQRAREGGRPELQLALLSARRLLFVCHGNIIRSAFSAHLLSGWLGPCARVAIQSAGLEALPGRPAHPLAISEAAAYGVDLSAHAAGRLAPQSIDDADVIFVMDVPQLRSLLDRFPGARSKAFLLSSLSLDVPLEIADPVFGDADAFRRCFTNLTNALRPVARLLAPKDQPC